MSITFGKKVEMSCSCSTAHAVIFMAARIKSGQAEQVAQKDPNTRAGKPQSLCLLHCQVTSSAYDPSLLNLFPSHRPLGRCLSVTAKSPTTGNLATRHGDCMPRRAGGVTLSSAPGSSDYEDRPNS